MEITVRRDYLYWTIFFLVIALGLFIFFRNLKTFELEAAEIQNLIKNQPMIKNKGKILMVVSPKDFRDEEFFVPAEIFKKSGYKVEVASIKKGMALGADGGEVKIDYSFDDVNLDDFKAVVFVGGPGALENLDKERTYQFIKEVVVENKLLGAICISPVILAKAGVLKGKKATVWSSVFDKSPIELLKKAGAIYQEGPVVQDGKIITGNGPKAAREFAQKIIEALKSEK